VVVAAVSPFLVPNVDFVTRIRSSGACRARCLYSESAVQLPLRHLGSFVRTARVRCPWVRSRHDGCSFSFTQSMAAHRLFVVSSSRVRNLCVRLFQLVYLAVSPKEAIAFVERHGVVLQAARGPVPSLAEAIAGGPIPGSWWSHPKGRIIFRAAQAISESPEVLVCKLIDDKVTFVHRRLWPALVKLAPRFRKSQLAKVWEEHTESGAHRSRRIAFPQWVPREVILEAATLSNAEAEHVLSALLAKKPMKKLRTGRSR